MKTKKLVLTALTVTLLGSGAVFAQGNSENSNGHGANDNGNNGRGAIASELKWRNAAHASAQAFLNANPNSAVGKLATLRNAAQATADAYTAAGVNPADPLRDPVDIQTDIDAISGAGGSIEGVQADIDLLDPASPTYEFDRASLTEEMEALEAIAAQFQAELILPTTLVGTQDAEAQAEAVVGIGTGDGELSPEAVAALWELLEM